jgi:hypothetical protein
MFRWRAIMHVHCNQRACDLYISSPLVCPCVRLCLFNSTIATVFHTESQLRFYHGVHGSHSTALNCIRIPDVYSVVLFISQRRQSVSLPLADRLQYTCILGILEVVWKIPRLLSCASRRLSLTHMAFCSPAFSLLSRCDCVAAWQFASSALEHGHPVYYVRMPSTRNMMNAHACPSVCRNVSPHFCGRPYISYNQFACFVFRT